jgi:hypothetical protein
MSAGFLTHLRALGDPVERRWLAGRLRGRWTTGSEQTSPAWPAALPKPEKPGSVSWNELTATITSPLILPLPSGETIRLSPGQTPAIAGFDTSSVGPAFHGFAWASADPDGAALATLWPLWLASYATEDRSQLAWAPDATAERALVLLDAGRRIGLPAPRQKTIEALAGHVAPLLASLGEPDLPTARTIRRGHALARLGLDLAMPELAGFGLTLVVEEATRLLGRSGMSKLGSTQHHLRLCHSLADLWLAARRQARIETADLELLLRQALAALSALTLQGHLPLIGDTIPTLPPDWLSGLIRGRPTAGWMDTLPTGEKDALTRLRDESLLADLETLRTDGWLRLDVAGWSGLWHAEINGWKAEDGSGHQDLGSGELHFEGVPIFVDAGGCSLAHRSAAAHGGLQLDGLEPYPSDRPYYDDAFRQAVAGKPPQLKAEWDGASLAFHMLAGAAGLRDGVRHWHLDRSGLSLDDLLNGNGRYRIERRFVTPLAVSRESDGAVLLEGEGRRFRLSAEVPLAVSDTTMDLGYGHEKPVRLITAERSANLPWRGRIRLDLA